MILDETVLGTYLALYGADVDAWPEDMKMLGRAARQRLEFAPLFAREQRFEALLAAHGPTPTPIHLAERIIDAAREKSRHAYPSRHFMGLAGMFRPSALVAMLVLGFAIGFGALAPVSQTAGPQLSQQAFPDDEGAML